MDRIENIQTLFNDLKGNKKVEAFLRFSSQFKAENVLDEKVKNLIHIALAVCCQCDLCIAFHIQSAVENGSTKEEILDAAMQAVLMGGGPKLMYMNVVNEELKYYFSDD